MKKFLIVLFLLVAAPAFAATSNFSAKTPKMTIEEPLREWRVGEKLVFQVYWMGAHIGTGTLEVKEKVSMAGREAYHLIARAKTNDFLSKIYPVEDEIHSFVDAENFYSLEFRKILKEGRYRADERITYDYEKKKAFYESFWNKSKKEIDLEGPARDLLSVFYWFRLQPVKVGEKIHTQVNSEEKNWDVELAVLSYENKELRGGKIIPTIVVEPKTRFKGILYNRGRAWVHFSADKKRVPVTITIKTGFGPVVGVLTPLVDEC